MGAWGEKGGYNCIFLSRMLVPFDIRFDDILFIASTDVCVVAIGGLRAEGENKNGIGSDGASSNGTGVQSTRLNIPNKTPSTAI